MFFSFLPKLYGCSRVTAFDSTKEALAHVLSGKKEEAGRDAPFAARRRYRQQSGQDSSLPKRSTEQVADRFLGKTDTIKSLVVRLQLSRSGGAFLPVPPGFGISFCACFSLSEKAISCPAFFKNHSCRQTYLFMLQSPLFSVLLHDSL